VTQLAGRIGRGALGGRVLVQTLAPQARSIGFAVGHDADGFVSDELTRRRALRYPPYASLIRVVCAAEDEALARRVASAIHAELASLDAEVLGPAPLFRLRGRAREQLVVKAVRRQPAIDAVGRAVDAVAPDAAKRQRRRRPAITRPAALARRPPARLPGRHRAPSLVALGG